MLSKFMQNINKSEHIGSFLGEPLLSQGIIVRFNKVFYFC